MSNSNSGPESKPIVVISKCLEFDACRYNGETIAFDLVRKLRDHVTFVPVCPELEIGLGVPRDPIKIVQGESELRLVQPTTGRDISDDMRRFADQYLGSLAEVDGFILKSRSPSCGIKDVKIRTGDGEGTTSQKTTGFFAGAVKAKFRGLAIEDEWRLTNDAVLREHWLTKVFLLARFREAKQYPSVAMYEQFYDDNKLLLMSYEPLLTRRLFHLISGSNDNRSLESFFADFEETLISTVQRPTRPKVHANVLTYAMGYFKEHLSSTEKKDFLDLVERFRAGQARREEAMVIIEGWVDQYDNEHLRHQTYFRPYPAELGSIN